MCPQTTTHRPPAPRSLIALLGALALANVATAGAESNWPWWRGPLGTGEAPGANPPVTWSATENVRWTLDLPGRGSSTPIVWGERLYVMTAVPKDAEQPDAVHEFRVLAIERKAGAVVWDTVVAEVKPHEAGHETNTQASSSPVTDGEHVLAFFGSRGLHCLDMDGKLVWSKDLGKMETRRGFGEGCSPALSGDVVVVVWDHEGDDFIAAFDKRSGKELWRQKRDEPTTWATPVIASVGERQVVISAATNSSRAYDLASGELIWSLGGQTTNCIPTPILRDGRVWLMSGFRGSALQCVKLEGAEGDLADGENVLWSRAGGTSYVPSALLMGEFLYFMRGNTGVMSCVAADTGEVVYEGEKLGDVKTVYGSPVGAGDHVYVPSREGLVAVVKAGPEFQLIAQNHLDDTFDASPVIVGDALYLRGWDKLYCIAKAAD